MCLGKDVNGEVEENNAHQSMGEGVESKRLRLCKLVNFPDLAQQLILVFTYDMNEEKVT